MRALSLLTTLSRKLTLERRTNFWLNELNDTWSVSETRARVVDVINETEDVQTFVLAPNHLWTGHRAGQFVPVSLEIEGVRVSRCYSLSSSPSDRYPTITVKRVPGGRVSSWMHDHLVPGSMLRLGKPAGDFVLPAEAPSKLLLLSGGSGITPVMSILRDLSSRNAVADVVFVHAARTSNDVVFARELAKLSAQHPNLRVEVFVEEGGVGQNVGRVNAAKLKTAVPDFAERDTFLCGPTGMMDALAPTWESAGIARRLIMERFVGPSRVLPAAGSAPTKVRLTLAKSQRVLDADGTATLLEGLEAKGETPTYGCRMGICNSCVCRKRSGVVENIHTGALSSEHEEDIRLCVSRARTDVELSF